MLRDFSLPTYREIPAVGLYLDQTSKYINEVLQELPDCNITNSMISNYVNGNKDKDKNKGNKDKDNKDKDHKNNNGKGNKNNNGKGKNHMKGKAYGHARNVEFRP